MGTLTNGIKVFSLTLWKADQKMNDNLDFGSFTKWDFQDGIKTAPVSV